MESESHFGVIKEYYDELERDPESPIFVALADAYRESGLIDEALAVCQRGLKVHPNYAAAHLVLGQIYMDKGMADAAEQELNLTLQLDPKNAIALAALGYLHAVTNRHETAVKYLDQANFLSPDDVQIAKYLEEAKHAAGQHAGHEKKRSRRSSVSASGSDEPPTGMVETFLSDLSKMPGVDASLLVDETGRHQASGGAGHLLDDSLGINLLNLFSGSPSESVSLIGNMEKLLVEGTEGSLLITPFDSGYLAAVLSTAAQPGTVALNIECFVEQEG